MREGVPSLRSGQAWTALSRAGISSWAEVIGISRIPHTPKGRMSSLCPMATTLDITLTQSPVDVLWGYTLESSSDGQPQVEGLGLQPFEVSEYPLRPEDK